MESPRRATPSPSRREVVLGAATVLVVVTLVVLLRLSFNSFDPSRFVWAGVPNADPAAVPDGLYVHPESAGFDGQFYYRLALDPATASVSDQGITLDIPSYRHQRIVYPALAWAASGGGRSGPLPVVLIVVNVVGLVALGGIAAALAVLARRPWWWGLPIAAAPGLAVALCRDTTEITAAALMAGGALALRRSRPAAAAGLLTLAVLARETALFLPAGVGLAWCVRAAVDRRLPSIRELVPAAVPGLVFIGWQLALAARWGTMPVFSGAGAAGLPIVGIFRTIAMGAHGKGAPEHLFDLLTMAFVIAFAVLAVVASARSEAPLHERIAVVFAAGVVLCLNPVQWDSHLGLQRAAVELSVLGCLVLASTRDRRFAVAAPVALAATVVVSAATAGVGAVFV